MHNTHLPSHVSPPGETLQKLLDERQMSQAELADRTGRPRKMINEIVKGKAAISPETALRLERVLGVAASFWNELERNYRDYLARQQEEEILRDSAEWLRRVPVHELIQRGWIAEREGRVEQIREVLNYFGVASPAEWKVVFEVPQANYRSSAAGEKNAGALAAWLRRGEIEAQRIRCSPFDRDQFERVLRHARNITIRPPDNYLPRLVKLCASAGVALVYVPDLAKCGAYGATRWLSPTKALIQLSLKSMMDDHFWLTLFHQAAHLLFHGKRLTFLETEGDRWSEEEEERADRYAEESLIPAGRLEPLREAGEVQRIGRTDVLRLAQELRIAPGVLVGKLQREGWLKPSDLNGLKVPVESST